MIRIELKDEQVAKALAAADAALDDLTPVMQEIGEMLTISTKDRMRRGETPEGSPFPPRSPTTLALYKLRGVRPKGGPLDRTGDLIGGIYARPGPASVEVGSNARQSAVMQFGAAQGAFGRTSYGGPIPYGAIPARPYLGLSDQDREGIADIVAEWLAGIASPAG